MSDNKKQEELEDGTLLDDKLQSFQVSSMMGNGVVEILAEKDEQGDYPVLIFYFKDGERDVRFAVKRDELAAITFALARQDQQHKLLDARFQQYKEVPVRLIVQTTKDLKKGDYVVVWRKERVPMDYNYTKI